MCVSRDGVDESAVSHSRESMDYEIKLSGILLVGIQILSKYHVKMTLRDRRCSNV